MKEFPNIEKYLPKDGLDYQRLVHFQEVAKANGYAKGHLWMAGLAAFPVFLTPDLLHKIWLNFRHISYQNGESLDIDRMAVSDLLLSTLVEEVAVEVFKIRPQIRTALLALLKEWAALTKDGNSLVRRLADFTLRYVRSYQMEGESVTTAIREAQEWNALAYFNPNAAALELKKALSQAVESQAKQKVLRISLMLSEMDDQFTQLGQQEQQAQFRTLVNYSQGMRALIRGEKAQAVEAFKNIDRQAIAPSEGAPTGKRVQLPIPKEIYQAIAVEPTGESTAEAGQVFALLVGIAEYENVEAGPYPSGVPRDLEFWQDFFSNQVEGEVQINSLLNGAATKAAVLEAIKLECRKATAGGQVFFFFSGLGENKAHGREEAAILLHDHNPKSNAGRLLESEFREQVVAFLPEGAEITIVLDTSSGGKNWINTDKTGRFIYNATDIDQGAQESPEGGLLTRAFRQALSDVGAPYFTHIGLMRHLRSLMPSLSNGNDQIATWYGRRDQQTAAFLKLPSPSSLRLRELMVYTGLARSVSAVDVQAVLQQFRSDHSIPAHLSVEKALEIWAFTNNKSFQVFISQSGQNLALKPYLEDFLLDKNIPHEIFTHDLQREKELEMQKARPIAENDWSVRLVEADFVLLQIDDTWIKDPISLEVTALLQLRLMETQVPYKLVYASTCTWNSHPVGQLGAAWPTESIIEVYANKEEQEFVADFRDHLASPIDYIECFLSNPSSELGIKMLQEQFISALLEDVGRYHPEEVAQLSVENAEQADQLNFIQNHYPAPVGQALSYLLQSRPHSEQLSATAQAWFMIVHTLNTFLLALLRQLIKRSGDELKELLKELDSAARPDIPNWWSGPSASAALLQVLQGAKQLPGLLEELGVHPDTWQQLTVRDLPRAVSDKVPLEIGDTDHGRQVQATLSSNYSNLIQWCKRLEVLINLKWENICQLYSAKAYTPVLFYDQALNPFSENTDFFRFSHLEGEGQQLHFTDLGGTTKIIEQGTEDTGQVWESFQELFQLLSTKKTIPAHPEQVHALLIGINDYPESLPSLRAPENDTLQFKAYLDRQPLEAQTEILSGAVTKENVIKTLTDVVEKASPGDAVIFYFSGLGQKEQSPRLNDTIPAILTFDQQRIPIDEIVYLLCQDKEKALQPIIILDMGVNANISKENRAAGLRPKGIDAVGAARDWNNYQFGNQIQSMEAWGAFMQEASFVLMVGCDYDNESGLEEEQGSFFTRNVIEVLSRSRHFLPYPVLQERLSEVLSHQVPQTPDIRVEGPRESMSSPNFLGQPSIDFQPMYGRVEWNRRLQQWTMDMGSRFGVTTGQIVHLSGIDYRGNSLARIEGIYDDFSTLIFGDEMPGRSSTFLGFVDEFLSTPPLQLTLDGWEEETRETIARGLIDYFPAVIFLNEEASNYTIQAESEGFSVRSREEPSKVIFTAISKEPLHQTDGIRTMMRRLVMANALIHLSNNDITQDPFVSDIEIELLYQDGSTETNLLEEEQNDTERKPTYELDLTRDHEFQLTVTNQTNGRRYIAVLLIQADLGIRSLIESSTVISLAPQESQGSMSWNQVQRSTDEGNRLASLHTVKVIISDQPFQLNGWLQEGMNGSEGSQEGNASPVETVSLKHDNLWSIQTFQIKHKSTEDGVISVNTLKKLLNDNKINEILDTLFPLIPEEEELFQQLVSIGSRFNEIQRVKVRRMAEVGPLAIQERRIEQSLSQIISSKGLGDILANREVEAEQAEFSARQTWHLTLLKQGIAEALHMLPSFVGEDQSARQMLVQLQGATEKNSMNFSGIRINLEEYMLQYSRLLVQLNSWVSSFDPEVWNGAEDSSNIGGQDDLQIEKLEKLRRSVKDAVMLGDFVEALEILRDNFPTHPQTQNLLLLQATLNQINQDINFGLTSAEQGQLYRNRIVDSILSFLDKPQIMAPPTIHVPWNGAFQVHLLRPFLVADLDQCTTDLLKVLQPGATQYDKAIVLRNKFLQLQANRQKGHLSEEDFLPSWSEIANTFLDIVRELPPETEIPPETESPAEAPVPVPPDLTLTIDRQQQFDQFAKAINEKRERLQVVFIPAPPKSEPQHFLRRLTWHIKPVEESDTMFWDPIFINSSTPLHRLSGQLEKAWEQQWRTRAIKSPDQMLISMQFDQDWFENRDQLAAWLASEGSKRVEEIRVKQVIAVIILEVPEVNSRTAIGRLLRGDPLKRQLDWLESLTGEYNNATVLPTLGKVSLDDIDDWLGTLAGGIQTQGSDFDLGTLRDRLAQGQTLRVLELLRDEPSLTEEDRQRLAVIQSRFTKNERSKSLGIISAADGQVQEAKALQELLAFIAELENKEGFDLTTRIRGKILDQLSSSLGESTEGYDMESVLKAVNSLPSFPILNKVKSKESKNKVEEEFWKETTELGNLRAYENYSSRYPTGEHITEANTAMERLRRITLSHESGSLSSPSTNEEGRQLSHQLRVKVEASSEDLAAIKEVTYYLHESFKNKEVSRNSVRDNFELRLKVWGIFTIKARIQFNAGADIVLERKLDF